VFDVLIQTRQNEEMIKYEMKNAFKMEVPLDVDWELVKRLAGSINFNNKKIHSNK
jgi:hypothetical protein